MFNLRTKDHLRREAESFARMRRQAAEMDERISAAMDRWQGQIVEFHGYQPEALYPELGAMANRCLARCGIIL